MRIWAGFLFACLTLGAACQPASADDVFSTEQKAAIEGIVHDYYLNHPDAFIEAIRRAQSTIRASGESGARATIAQRRKDITGDTRDPVVGDLNGDVTLVEFFDYRCPYCKRSQPDLAALMKEDPHVRIVYKELPVLGQDSVFAARASLAAGWQGKYQALHDAMLAAPAPLTNEAVVKLAEAQGLDKDRLLHDMTSPEIAATLARNSELAHALGINGTPSFVIGDLLVPGAIEPAGLRKLIAAQRNPAHEAPAVQASAGAK